METRTRLIMHHCKPLWMFYIYLSVVGTTERWYPSPPFRCSSTLSGFVVFPVIFSFRFYSFSGCHSLEHRGDEVSMVRFMSCELPVPRRGDFQNKSVLNSWTTCTFGYVCSLTRRYGKWYNPAVSPGCERRHWCWIITQFPKRWPALRSTYQNKSLPLKRKPLPLEGGIGKCHVLLYV